MGFRIVSNWLVFSAITILLAACGGDSEKQSAGPQPSIEGIWTPQTRFKTTFVIKNSAYQFFEEKNEVEKGTLTYNGKSLVTKDSAGIEHTTPVKSLSHDTLVIGQDDSVTIYKRVSQKEFNEYLGIVPNVDEVPQGAPTPPPGDESLEGFWALQEAREGAQITQAKPGELLMKIKGKEFESHENGKITEKGQLTFTGLAVITHSEKGEISVPVQAFRKDRLIVGEGKKRKTFKRVTEEEYQSLMKGVEPPKVERVEEPAPTEEGEDAPPPPDESDEPNESEDMFSDDEYETGAE